MALLRLALFLLLLCLYAGNAIAARLPWRQRPSLFAVVIAAAIGVRVLSNWGISTGALLIAAGDCAAHSHSGRAWRHHAAGFHHHVKCAPYRAIRLLPIEQQL